MKWLNKLSSYHWYGLAVAVFLLAVVWTLVHTTPNETNTLGSKATLGNQEGLASSATIRQSILSDFNHFNQKGKSTNARQHSNSHKKQLPNHKCSRRNSNSRKLGNVDTGNYNNLMEIPFNIQTLIHITLPAISKVESNDDDNAIGDNGNSLGRFQIQKPFFQDSMNRTYGTNQAKWPTKEHKDVHKSTIAYAVTFNYHNYYSRIAIVNTKTTNPLNAVKIIARVHNGGPRGHEKEATHGYSQKVVKELCSQLLAKQIHTADKENK
tara:strand:- start:307 stop:1104 length:798 start_codon:yes stop_codon:yes gene_type:complete